MSKIETPQRELTIGVPIYGQMPEPKRRIRLTRREKQVVTLLAEGLPYREISETLNISVGNARLITHRMRLKITA